MQQDGGLKVPERILPLPGHLSPEAQAFLARPHPPRNTLPALDDREGWKRQIAASDAMILNLFVGSLPEDSCRITPIREGDVSGFDIVPRGVAPGDRRVYLDIHGGALIYGGGDVCRAMAMGSALRLGVRVVAVDYRMAPDHPHPVPLDDCLAFYRMLLRDHAPREIIVGGGSAGANLAAALMLRVRDEGLPLPAACVLLSPEVDLTESGDSFATNAGIDGMGSLMGINLLHANGQPLDHPYLSPLFGDFTQGVPPTLLTAGTRDLFLSNAVRMHRALRKAGIDAELHVQEAAVHGAFGGNAPEDAEIGAEQRCFCEKWWAAA